MLCGVDMSSAEQLIRRLIAGDATAIEMLIERAATSDDPVRR